MDKLVRQDLEDTYGILDLQNVILNITAYIDGFCREHNIEYCLMAGSALGARRHQGFIPWDDDLDIYMTAADYDKFRAAFSEYGDKEKYYLQEYGKTDYKNRHMITKAKLKLNGSIIEEKGIADFKAHKGIFVDIFIIHNAANGFFGRLKQYIWSETVVLKGLCVRGYKAKNFKDKVLLTIAKLLPTKWTLRHGLYNAYKFDGKNCDKVMGFIDTRKYSRAVFPKSDFFPAKYGKFETIELKVPADNDHYLKIQFGDDYMTPPPEDKKPVNKHVTKWAIDKNLVYETADEDKFI